MKSDSFVVKEVSYVPFASPGVTKSVEFKFEPRYFSFNDFSVLVSYLASECFGRIVILKEVEK